MSGAWGPILAHLRGDGAIVHPTETVYGFGAPMTPGGIAAVRTMKGRTGDHPFLLLLPPGGAGERWKGRLRWTPAARALAEAFWPGPVTLVLHDEEGWAPEGVVNRTGGVAVRESPNPLARELLTRWGEPLLSTSANRTGHPPASSAEAIREAFAEELRTGTLLLLDGGDLGAGRPSTLVDCTETSPRILREGAVSSKEVRTVLGDVDGK